MKRLIYVAAILLAAPAAWAASGGDIYASCASGAGTQGEALCAAYLNGFMGGVLVDQISSEDG